MKCYACALLFTLDGKLTFRVTLETASSEDEAIKIAIAKVSPNATLNQGAATRISAERLKELLDQVAS